MNVINRLLGQEADADALPIDGGADSEEFWADSWVGATEQLAD